MGGRLRLKARVISERGAVFKFPDDGRQCYFSALEGGGGASGSSTVDSVEHRARRGLSGSTSAG